MPKKKSPAPEAAPKAEIVKLPTKPNAPLTIPADFEEWRSEFEHDDPVWTFHLCALARGIDPLYYLVQLDRETLALVRHVETAVSFGGLQTGTVRASVLDPLRQGASWPRWTIQDVPAVRPSDFLRWYSRWAAGRDGCTLPEGLRGYMPDFAHSECFRSVTANGREYSFTTKQAAVVQTLYEHLARGCPDVSIDTLKDRAGIAERTELRQTFKKHPAWGTLIAPGEKKGTRRLKFHG